MASNNNSSSSGSTKRIGGVDFSTVMNRQVGDSRFERQKQLPGSESASGAGASSSSSSVASATFAAFTRMAAGVEGRRLQDKIEDPNRPTWEQYKKENEDKLLMVSGDVKKMAQYRAELDRDRERLLNQSTGNRKSNHAISDDDEDSAGDDNEDDDSSNSDSASDSGSNEEKRKSSNKEKSKKRKSKKVKSKKHKKEKSHKHKKSKKQKRSSSDSDN